MGFVDALLLSFVIETLLLLVISTIEIGPRVHELQLFDKFTPMLYVLFLLVSIGAIGTGQRHASWFYLFALLNGSVAALCLITRRKNSLLNHFILIYVISMPLIVIGTSLILNGLVPLTRDEGRFLGYALRIIKDGRWVPFKYNENTYYQYFPVLSFIEASISMVANIDLLHGVPVIVVLCLTLAVSLLVWVLARRALTLNEHLDSRILPVLSITLFLCTPPISPIGFIPTNLSAYLYLLALLVIARSLNEGRKAYVILLILAGLAGILTHPIYVILTLVSFGTFILIKKLVEKGRLKAINGIKTTILMASVYWCHTLIMDQLTNTGKLAYDSLMDISTGRVLPTFTARPMWYANIPPEIASSWALLPAFATVLLLLSIRKFRTRKDPVSPFHIGLGLAGLFLLAFSFLSRMTQTPIHRYFYSAYFLLLLPSLAVLKEIASKRRTINTLVAIVMVSMISFYAIQDFTPDILKPTPVPNANSVIIATTISNALTPRVLSQEQSDIAIVMEYLVAEKMPELLYPLPRKFEAMIIVTRLDYHGRTWCAYNFGEEVLRAIEEGAYPVVYDCALTRAYYIPLGG